MSPAIILPHFCASISPRYGTQVTTYTNGTEIVQASRHYRIVTTRQGILEAQQGTWQTEHLHTDMPSLICAAKVFVVLCARTMR